MKNSFVIATLLFVTGCAPDDKPSIVANQMVEQSKPIVVLVQGADDFFWNGWHASHGELPELVKQYHPSVVVLSGQKNSVVEFSDLLKLRDAIMAAGVKDVQIGVGGVTGG